MKEEQGLHGENGLGFLQERLDARVNVRTPRGEGVTVQEEEEQKRRGRGVVERLQSGLHVTGKGIGRHEGRQSVPLQNRMQQLC